MCTTESKNVFVEFSTEEREKAITEYVRALTELLQIGISPIVIGENTDNTELYYVFTDEELRFTDFLTMQLQENGSITSHNWLAQNKPFEHSIGLFVPAIIENCDSLEDMLKKAGIKITVNE